MGRLGDWAYCGVRGDCPARSISVQQNPLVKTVGVDGTGVVATKKRMKTKKTDLRDNEIANLKAEIKRLKGLEIINILEDLEERISRLERHVDTSSEDW